MILDVLHKTAVCGLVGVTIYGLLLIGRGTLSMEKARRKHRLLQAENSDKEVLTIISGDAPITVVLQGVSDESVEKSSINR